MDLKPVDLTTIQTNTDLTKVQNKAETLNLKTQDSELKEACHDFVSILLSKVFKDMDESINRSGLTEEAYGNKWFRQMVLDEYSKEASKQSLKPLADSLYRDITRSRER
ncbi:MAG: rod-binding protein [Thermotogota bacterium]